MNPIIKELAQLECSPSPARAELRPGNVSNPWNKGNAREKGLQDGKEGMSMVGTRTEGERSIIFACNQAINVLTASLTPANHRFPMASVYVNRV